MEAGGSHSTPRVRQLAGALFALLVLACSAAAPAHAEGVLPGVAQTASTAAAQAQTTVSQAAPQLQKTAEQAVATARPAASPSPAPEPVQSAAQAAVTPAAGAVAAVTPVPPSAQVHRPGKHARSSHVRVSSSARADRLREALRAERNGSHGAADRPAVEPVVTGHAAAWQASVAAPSPEDAAAMSQPAPEPGSSGSTAGGAASSAASSGLFFFGGAFALFVAAFLLAGPNLRRLLTLPPAVCRPAAFVLVLERPG
jgi:hypothetical protein